MAFSAGRAGPRFVTVKISIGEFTTMEKNRELTLCQGWIGYLVFIDLIVSQ